jgi:serpin B
MASGMRKHTASIAFVLAASVAAIGCGDNADTPPNNSGIEQARSALARIENPTISDADRTAFANGQRTFALDAYRILAGRPGNVVYSPHSVQVALAMTSAGARGTTASQMETALHFGLPQERLHAAFNALDRDLAQRATRPLEGTGQRFRLRSANALWGQRGYTFLAPFLDTLAQHYGAGMNLVDFMGDADGSRLRINRWVSDQTEARIPNLLPMGSVTPLTRLVLTNAVYFNASWQTPFEASRTAPATFTGLDDATRSVPMMNRALETRYAEVDGVQAVELPYVGGDVSMLLVLPPAGRFTEVEQGLTAARLDALVNGLQTHIVDLRVPTFSFRTQASLKMLLQSLGMTDAFTALADLSGINGARDLYVQDVVHEGFIAVNEQGTEAAAATAVIAGTTSVPQPATFHAVRPFLFALRDNPTGTLLFVGRVVAP